jgi:hypothetical protein
MIDDLNSLIGMVDKISPKNDNLFVQKMNLVPLILEKIKGYVNSARIQLNRVEENKQSLKKITECKNWNKESAIKMSELNRQIFNDIHFYFICWNIIWKMLGSLKQHSILFKTPKKIQKKYGELIEKYSKGRDNLEHFDERLKGKKRRRDILSSSGDLGNLDIFGKGFSFNGENYDIMENIKKLEIMLNELEQGIREESVEIIKKYNPKLLKIL